MARDVMRVIARCVRTDRENRVWLRVRRARVMFAAARCGSHGMAVRPGLAS